MLLSVGEHLLICWKPKWNKREIRRNWSFSPASYWDLYHWFLWFSGLQIQTELWPVAFLGLQHSRQTVGFLSLHEDMSQFLIIKKNVFLHIHTSLGSISLKNPDKYSVYTGILSGTFFNIPHQIPKGNTYPLKYSFKN